MQLSSMFLRTVDGLHLHYHILFFSVRWSGGVSPGVCNIGLLSKGKISCFLTDLGSASAADLTCGQRPVISDLTYCEAVLSFLFSAY